MAKAKDRVKITTIDPEDGAGHAVWVTRAEVEGALAELNRPAFQPGDIVVRAFRNGVRVTTANRFVVVGVSTREALAKAFSTAIRAHDLVVIGLHDGSCYNGLPETYEKVDQ